MTKKEQESRKTGAAGDVLTELDEIVLNVLGRESPNLKPVQAPDSVVSFGGRGDILATIQCPVQQHPAPPNSCTVEAAPNGKEIKFI